MKKAFELLTLTFFAASMAAFYGCKKDAEIPDLTTIPTLTTAFVSGITITTATSGGYVTSDGGTEVTERGVCWSIQQVPTIYDPKTIDGVATGSFTSNLTGLIPGTTYFVRAYAVNSEGVAYGNLFSFTTSFPPGIGARKADFPGGARYLAAAFSIGTKIYLGLGWDDGDNPRTDFWEWDQATNTWARKADFPGNTGGDFVCFSIGTKGYIGTGNYISTHSSTYDFWEYDSSTNSWTQKESLPVAPARSGAVGFSIGTKGYIGIGNKWGLATDPYYKDFWEWDQETNIWTQKTDFPGNARVAAAGFSIGNKGYIGTGYDGTNYSNEFWEWDQSTNVWAKKADFGEKSRGYAVGFSIGNKGYIGTGYKGSSYSKEFWEWDQATNVWTKLADFKGNPRISAVGVSIGNKGYIGTGFGDLIYAWQDFWEYDPTLK